MATTTKQNSQFYANGPSIDANTGPWSSISEYTTWLADELGLEAPYEGTEIQVKDSTTGKITKYLYEVVSGSARWTEDGAAAEYKGITTDADALNAVTDYGFYYLRTSFLRGFLSVSFDYNLCVTQHLLANQKPVYENGAITQYTTGAVFLSRRYVSGAWTEWTDAAAEALAAATEAESDASAAAASAEDAADSATAAQTAANTASNALTTIQTAISNLDPSTSTEDAIVALTAQVAALDAKVDAGCSVTVGSTTYNDY